MRLTNKSDSLGYTRKFEDPDAIRKITRKLGQLEDKEEKFGIDLLVLLEALSSGIYYRSYNGEIKYLYITEFWVFYGRFGYGWDQDPSFLYFENYGKKEEGGWALTKEELE